MPTRAIKGKKHQWYAIQKNAPLGQLRKMAVEGKDPAAMKRMRSASSRSLMQTELLRGVSLEGQLNCPACTMPLLDPVDPQYDQKATLIVTVCHGGPLCDVAPLTPNLMSLRTNGPSDW